MKRPLLILSISLGAGILAAQVYNSYLFIAISVMVLTLTAALLSCKFTGIQYILIGVVLFYSIGAFEYCFVDNVNRTKFTEFSGKDVAIKAFIASEPDVKESSVSYIVSTEQIASREDTKKTEGKQKKPETKVAKKGGKKTASVCIF